MLTKKCLHHFFAKRLFILACISMVIFWASQLLGRYVWQLELFSHFVPYYAVVFLSAGLIYPKKNNTNFSAKTKTNFLRGIFVLFGFVMLLWCLPNYEMIDRYIHKSPNENRTEKRAFIAYQNVNISNQQKQHALSALTNHNPSVLILLEAGGDWLPHLQALKKDYSVHCGDDQHSPFAMQVYAKNNHTQNNYVTCKEIHLPNVSHDMPLIRLDMGETIIYAVHPPPPISAGLARSRTLYLQGLRTHVKQESMLKDIIVIGDMNTSVFSPVYRDFIKGTKLQRTTAGGTVTWSLFNGSMVKNNLGRILGLGIDHYFTSMAWRSKVTLLGYHGSDHRGFLVQ